MSVVPIGSWSRRRVRNNEVRKMAALPDVMSAASDEYDGFSEIYSVWTDTAPAARASLDFYTDLYGQASGTVVELGVGDGRIAVAAAMNGCSLVGIDASSAML